MDPREREAREAKARQKQELLNRAYDRVISAQLSKISSKKTFTEDDEEAYRQKVARDREIAQSKKRKTISAEHAELARTTGLSGHVVALMAGHDDGSEGDATNHDDDRSASGSDGGNRKRRKKSKKKHKKKDSKKGTLKGRRKRRRDYSSDSESSHGSKDDDKRRKITHHRNVTKESDESASISNESRSKKHDRKSIQHSSESDSDSTRSRDRDRNNSRKRKKHKSRSKSKRSKRQY